MAQLKRKIKKDKVRVSNDIITSFVKNNNIVSLKIMFFLSSNYKIKSFGKSDKNLVKIKIKKSELMKEMKISNMMLINNLLSLQKTQISWKTDDYIDYVVLIPRFIDYRNGNIEVFIFNDVLEKIIEVKKKYTNINLNQLSILKSKHSIKMLMLLSRINGYSKDVYKKVEYELDELNAIFGTKYKSLRSFCSQILDKVKTELDIKSSLSFIYEKRGDILENDKNPQRGRPKLTKVVIYLIDNNPRPTLF